jgi:predicted FMN-binding regulatory protein PaiB
MEVGKVKNRSCYKIIYTVIFYTCCITHSHSQILMDFKGTGKNNEQELWIKNGHDSVTININAPLHFNKKGKTFLVLFALPNGNSIEWTKGKKMKAGEDWHFDIQHIAGQTRFVRELDKKNNYIVAYLMTDQKSWPYWKRTTANSKVKIKNIVDDLYDRFKEYQPKIILNGHSGGGSFIFGYLDIVEKIPDNIERIAFLDSDYGYEDSLHTKKITAWLQNKNHHLFVLAYNDSIVIFNGKQLVSPTGGTWYRSRLMQRKLSEHFSFKTKADTSFIDHSALNGRVRIILKENPNGLIYHTVQVEKNGFIFSLLSNTRFDRRKNFSYWGDRVYDEYITD